MENEKRILDEVEETLQSLDKISNLNANPFLYTRIKAKIGNKAPGSVKNPGKNFILRPVILVIILLINIITAVVFIKSVNNTDHTSVTLTKSLSNEYRISSTQYDNLKLE